MLTENPYLGVGLYTLPEAARILQVPVRKLSRWAEGYTFASNGRARASSAVVERSILELAPERIVTFAELVELKLVELFREAGVSMPTIRQAQQVLRDRYGVAHPFAVRRVRTDGKRLFEEQIGADASSKIYEELARYQFVLSQAAVPFFKKLEYEDELVRRYWPIGEDRRVVLDPARSFGKPIESRSGVPTHVLYSMALAGESPEAIAGWYGVDAEGVDDAIDYEKRLAA